ncbi:MAG: class I SAM-dependent methyltransferase [Candidatus Latescibacterota bacterium]
MEAYPSRFYDRYFVGVEGDVDFYVAAACQAGSPVLELGCGTGRVLLPLARAGLQVVGLDTSQALLEAAQGHLDGCPPELQARVRLVEGDMRSFRLGQRFRLVLAAYRTFQHLLTPADQEESLACIRRHLVRGGRLILDLFDPLGLIAREGLQTPICRDTDFVDPATGHQVLVYYTRTTDPQAQVLEQEVTFEEVEPAGRAVGRTHARLRLRYASRFEVEYLLARCGFEVEALYGDFGRSPYPGYGEQVWVLRRT